MPASSKRTGPKRAKKAASEPEAVPEESEAEGAVRKRPRRDADGVATCTNAAAHDDDLLCDWIDALAWLETAAATAQVRRLRELAAALDLRKERLSGADTPAQRPEQFRRH